ncbi:glycosyltransferase [Gelatiniphilus marinus]|uniref:Glycosyltransferase n=1 Tax=Gelatiniphilus marinus TaxID=1759464 RepID=A0ABW5JQU8_9FLAO
MLIFNIVQIVFLVLIGLATLYIFVFSVAGLFYKQATYKSTGNLKKIAVLIPGYKEDEVIVEVANSALLQDYPSNLYDVVVIADSFLDETLSELKALPIKLIEVSFEKSTKSKALNKAMASLTETYDIAVVLDADNLMATDFLKKINTAFHQGFIAVQGHRTAKNMNNSWAILDAVSEEINNHIFRKGHIALGLSSAIIGSGMAFKYKYFKSLMATVTAVGGFDKEIELKMLKAGYKIEYLDDAVVYDEKIQKAEVFGNQRRRWLSAQVHYFRKDFLNALKDLFLKGNIDYFDKAIQFIQPPRILLLGAVFIFGGLFILSNFLLNNEITFPIYWLLIATACILSFIFSIPKSFYNLKTLGALASLPKGMLTMLLSLLKIKGANKKFIHTKHGTSSE